jgi:hypothetical protein
MRLTKRINCCAITCFLIFTLCTLTNTGFAQSVELAKSKYNDVICACAYSIAVGINLLQKPREEPNNVNKDSFKIYEDGVLQEIEYFFVNDDEVTKKIGYRYKIGYASTNSKMDGSFRKIRVTFKMKRMRMIKVQLSSKGYFALEENRKKLGRLPLEESYSSGGCCN